MTDDRHARLIGFLERRAREHLRAVVRYSGSDFEVLRLRSDLRTRELERILPTLHERILDNRAVVTAEEYPPLGSVQATVELHEHGVLLHFVEGSGGGTVVTFDREAGQELAGFVEECTDILTG